MCVHSTTTIHHLYNGGVCVLCVCVYLYIIIASRDFFLVLNTNMNDSLKLETYRNILLTQSLGL